MHTKCTKTSPMVNPAHCFQFHTSQSLTTYASDLIIRANRYAIHKPEPRACSSTAWQQLPARLHRVRPCATNERLLPNNPGWDLKTHSWIMTSTTKYTLSIGVASRKTYRIARKGSLRSVATVRKLQTSHENASLKGL